MIPCKLAATGLRPLSLVTQLDIEAHTSRQSGLRVVPGSSLPHSLGCFGAHCHTTAFPSELLHGEAVRPLHGELSGIMDFQDQR